ncbi:MAG TPA: hypothetical protein VMZ51_07000 [Acidimicrobiales bacterium]|nr:hypothetical protein [Acidimicrobiales bacterium]
MAFRFSLTPIYPNLHLTGACQNGISASSDPSSDASGIVVVDLGRLNGIGEDDQGDADADRHAGWSSGARVASACGRLSRIRGATDSIVVLA